MPSDDALINSFHQIRMHRPADQINYQIHLTKSSGRVVMVADETLSKDYRWNYS